jgi:RimJ/RimL family protein N-acetyltransferase
VTPVLETARLVLRPLQLADADQIQQLFPQWEIVRYLTATVPWPYPPDGALVFCRDHVLPAVERGDAWAWTLRLKNDGERLIGVIELMTQANNNRGFWIDPRWQRQGLMTEASEVVTDYWFETLKFPVLRAPKAVANVASRRISEKQGMRVVAVEEHAHVSGQLPAEVWEITREEWQVRRQSYAQRTGSSRLNQWTPYPEINALLQNLLGRVRDTLGPEFVGMYLYGSLASGDFQPDRSDVDFVVVTEEPLAKPLVAALASMHRALASSGLPWANKLEGAYVPAAVLRRHDPAHPPVPILNEGKFYSEVLASDWILQRHQLRDVGGVVTGPEPRGLIDPIAAEDLRRAVHDNLLEWWAPMLDDPHRLSDTGYQPYAVLSMCRTLYTLEHRTLVSKSDAGRWALQTLPPVWASLVEAALRWRSGDAVGSVAQTMAFIRFTIARGRRTDRH